MIKILNLSGKNSVGAYYLNDKISILPEDIKKNSLFNKLVYEKKILLEDDISKYFRIQDLKALIEWSLQRFSEAENEKKDKILENLNTYFEAFKKLSDELKIKEFEDLEKNFNKQIKKINK